MQGDGLIALTTELIAPENKQVLAPLAFVSGLAGALLALKFMEANLESNHYNYWGVSPWIRPNYRLQKNLKTNPECEFCNDPIFLKTSCDLWT